MRPAVSGRSGVHSKPPHCRARLLDDPAEMVKIMTAQRNTVGAMLGKNATVLPLSEYRGGARRTLYFTRQELNQLLGLYSRNVICGVWRDYAIDHRDGQALFVSPYSHPDVIAGAGTIGLELLDQAPDLDSIVVPVGGGGLAGGVAIAAKSDQRPREVVGVEVEASTPFRRSLAAGRIVPIEVKTTLADGLAGNLDPDAITFELVQRLVDRMVVVSEPQLQQAIVGLLREERVVAEGAGATGVAAVLGSALDLAGRRIAVVVSGANIDIDTLMSLI